MVSFKNRWNLIKEEIIEKRGKRIYAERRIKDVMRSRYPNGEISLDSSYIYQKMDRLLDEKILISIWNSGTYAKEQGFVNIFELHKKLDHIIKSYHVPRRHNSIYTDTEKEYMELFMKGRGING